MEEPMENPMEAWALLPFCGYMRGLVLIEPSGALGKRREARASAY
jgi:hypothetical protein